MLKKILREYCNAFRLSNFKILTENDTWWIYCYTLTLMPLSAHAFNSSKNIICYYSIAIPLLFGLLTSDLYPLGLPKMMFLCPLDRKERISYVKLCYRVKVFFPTAFCALCMLIPVLNRLFAPLAALYIILIFFCTMLGCNLRTMHQSSAYLFKKENTDPMPHISVWSSFHVLSGFIILLFAICIAIDEDFSPFMLVFAFVGLFWMLPLTGRMLKFYRPILSAATDYEAAAGLAGSGKKSGGSRL